MIAGYGMSETCPILTLAHLRPHMRDWDVERKLPVLCRAGRPIPFVQLRIVDANMNDVAHDGVSQGEVVVRSPWLTQGYLDEPESSEELWRGGWLHTGDVGVIDAEGYLKIVDRIKDVVKTGGEWVSSLDIEDLVLRMPGIAEVGGGRRARRTWGERPVASSSARRSRGERRPRMRFASTCRTSPSAARSRSSRCPIACTSSTRFRRRASASSTRRSSARSSRRRRAH